MRTTLLITSLLLGWATSAAAQTPSLPPSPTPSRFAVAGVARIDHVYVDGHTDGTTPVGGAAASVRVSRAIAIEGELTGATREIARSYEGTFVSYAPPGSNSREEFERFAPTARRTLAYVPHLGGAAMVVARTAINPRVGLAGRLGVSWRGYSERSSYVVLSIPEGVDPVRVARDFQPQTVETVRGGLLLGVDVDLALTARFTLPLQMRFVYSGPGEFANLHRELGVGVSGRWQF